MENANLLRKMVKETRMNLNKPSKNEMDRISALWEKESSQESGVKNYKQQVKALEWLFSSYPNNTNENEIIIKVACLDRLYSTNITKSYKIPQVAQHILNLKFDDRVQKGDISLVDEIAQMGKQGGVQILSFASKYCVWHNDYIYKKDDFVIFDSIVKTKLKEFNESENEQCHFTPKFSKKDLKDYKKYKEILEKFREFFGLKCSFSDIDRYLWRLEKLRQIGKD